MRSSYSFFGILRFFPISLNNVGLMLTVLALLAAAAGASAEAALSRISCTSSQYSAASTDACSVYLTSPASNRMRVTLTSNNPAVKVPGEVTVRPGAATAGFNATVAAVATVQTATITAQTNRGESTFVVTLSPSGGSPALTLSATSLSFGNVSVGTAVTKSVTLTSSGTSAVTINSDSVTGTGFSVSGGGFPATLNPGQAAVLTVQFDPPNAASSTGQLTIASNAPTATASLSGTGTTVVPTVSAVSCGSISITGSLADACTVSLSGSAPTGGVTVSLASSSSAVKVPGSVTVPATATSATFTANVASVTSAQSVTLTATSGTTSKAATLQLKVATAALSLNATSVSFGSVAVNTTATQTVTLTSSGTSAVSVNSVAVTGAGFSVSPVSVPATLNPGQTLTISITFDPSATGAATGQLTISNSSTSPTLTVPLSGTANPHQVDLSWSAPTGSSVPIAGYKIYRAPSGSTSFAVVDSMDTQTTYTDTTVQAGQSYSYYVTSVDSAGVESAPSNTTSVTVP